jgi:hypothetical protein
LSLSFAPSNRIRHQLKPPIVSPSLTLERASFGVQVKEDGESVCGYVTERGARKHLIGEVVWALKRRLAVEVNFVVQPDPWAREGRAA